MHPNPFGLAHSQSPVDLPEPLIPAGHGLRWTSRVIGTAALLLALFNAPAIRGWAYELPDGPAAERASVLADDWFRATASLGFPKPVETVHGAWQRVKTARINSGNSPPTE